MKTYKQWQDELAKQRCEKYAKHTMQTAKQTLTPEKWWDNYLEPLLQAGESLSMAVTRSIVVNGPYRLTQVKRWFPNSIPEYVDIQTGRIVGW